MTTLSEKKALADAINIAGGQAALARKLGVKQQSVHDWLKKGLPLKRVLQVEQAANHKVSRYKLKPSLYPPSDYKEETLRKP